MRSKVYWGLLVGSLSLGASSTAFADDLTEYTSPAKWAPTVTGVSTYEFSGAPTGGVSGSAGVSFGPGTFTTPGNVTLVFNDGLYGPGVQYVAASPGAFGSGPPAAVDVSFKPSADVTALAFTLGSERAAADIGIFVNGAALAPITVSSGSPTAFFGVTDTTGPITNVAFAVENLKPGTQFSEVDVIGSYATAKPVKAPEMDPNAAASAIALLLGAIAILRGGRSKIQI